MKRTLIVILAFSFISMFMISSVAAATSQGFEWGVSVDDEFTYAFKFVDEGVTTLDERINITITSAPSIPDPMSDWTDIPECFIDIVYFNGTALGLEIIIILGVLAVGGVWVVPKGNYPLLSQFANESAWWSENHTIIDTYSNWGIRVTGEDDGAPTSLTLQYSKTDGVCSQYILEGTNSTSGKTSSASLIREGLGFDIVGFVVDNALYIGIGLVVLIVIVALTKKK